MRCIHLKSWLVLVILAINVGAQSPSNGPVSYVYDEMGRLTAVLDAAGNAAVYQYDAVGNVLSIQRYNSSQASVIGFTPSQGPAGTVVTISGTGFSTTPNLNSVSFNGASAAVISATGTQISVSVPATAASGPITIVSPAGSAISAKSFTVRNESFVPSISGFTPRVGVPGTSVTVNGAHFDTNIANDRLRFNIASAMVSAATPTSLATTTTSGATSGRISVATPAGSASSSDDFFVPFGTHTVADVDFTGRTTIGNTTAMNFSGPKIGLVVFDGIQGQAVNFQWTSNISACLFYLLAPNGSQVTSTGCSSGNVGLDNTVLPSAGTYTAGIEVLSSGGSLTLQLNDVSDVTGSIVIDGAPVTIATTKPNQDARLFFPATAGQRVVVRTTNVSNPSALIGLMGTTGEMLSGVSVNASPSTIYFIDTVPLVATGRYAILVRHSGSGIGAETLQVTNVPPDFTASIAIGGSPVRIPGAGDTVLGQNGILGFTASAGQKVSVSVISSSYSSCLTYLKDSAGNVLTSGNCSSTNLFTDTVTVAAAGTYSVLVDPQGMSTGTATVQLNDASDVTGTIAIDGPAVTATTSVPGQDARLTFSGVAGQRVFLQTTNVTNPAASVVLLAPDGTQQAAFGIANSPAGQTFVMDTQTLPASGTYTLWIKHNGSNVGSETLQLRTVAPDFTAPITIGGPAVRVPSSGNTAMGQNGILTFTAVAGQKVSVSTSNGTFSSCQMLLRDSVGTSLSSGSCSAATGYMDTATLSAGGNYNILIDPTGAATGTTTVALNNDSDIAGTITMDGSSVTATTTVPGQDARLTFNATAGQRITVQVTSVSNPSATVFLLRPDGTQQSWVAVGNNPAGQTFYIDTQILASAGTYTLWIQHSGAGIGSATLTLKSVPADFTAPITFGGPAVRIPTIGNNALGQNALLSFTATASEKISINLSNSTYSPFSSCMLTLADPSGNTVASGYCGSAANSPIFAAATVAGTYTILVDPLGMAIGTVTLSLVNNNDDIGTISIDGAAVTATTTVVGQDARRSFTATAGQRIVVRVTAVTNPAANVFLLRPDNTSQASVFISNSPAGQTWFIDTQSLGASGTYTLWVQHSGSAVGSETLQLTSVPADFSGSITIGGAAVRVPASGDNVLGQNGTLTFTASAGQKVSVTVSNGTYSPSTSCVVYLRNASASNLTSGYCGNGAPFIDTVTLSSGGTYTIFVDPQGTATGNTTIRLNDSSDVTGVISADGTPVIAATGLGQDARYTFSATAGQRLALSVTNVTNPSATVFLLKPDGSTQNSVAIGNSLAGQLFFIDTQTLTTQGTYTVWVKHSSANTGSATLQLNTVPADYTGSLTLGTATQVPPTGNLGIGQNARLTFAGNAGFQVNAQFSNNTIAGVTVTLLKTDGITALTSISTSAATFSLPTAMLPSDGTYTIAIDPTGAASGSVSMIVTQVGGSHAVPSRTGTSINPANPLSQNLVGLFLMNEGTGTTDKNVVDGQIATFASGAVPSTPPVWNTGDPSVVFNGTTSSLSSYLDVGPDPNFDRLPTNKMTVVTKVFLNSGGAGGIAEKTDDSSSGFTFGLDNNGALNLYVPKSSGPMRVATGPAVVTSGQWIQVAFTWDGTVGTASGAHIYVNGVDQTKVVAQDGTGTLSYAGATNKPFRIGNNSYFSPFSSLNGKIAYVAVYRYRVLTATELNQLDGQLPTSTDVVTTTTEDGTATSVTTTTGQGAHVTFQGWASQQVSVQMSNNTMGQMTVNLVVPDGTMVTQTTASATSFNLPTATLPSTGVYDVLVQGPATAGSISVKVVTQAGGRPNGSVIDTGNALSTNLVGLFLMNESSGTADKNVVDGQTATLASGATPSTPPAWNTSDTSLAFNGTIASLSSYLDAGTDLSFDQLPTTKVTLVARMFLYCVGPGGIAEKTDGFSSGFTFGLDNSGALNLYVPKSGSTMRVATAGAALVGGQWVQVAFTWDGTIGTASAAHIYVNGVEQTKVVAQDGTGTLSYAGATNKPFRIGNNSYFSPFSSLNGKMVYMAVYRGRILSIAELNQLDVQLPIR